MPPPIAALTGEMLRNPVTIQRERQAAPASGITQAVYPVSQGLKPVLLVELLRRGDVKQALVFTRTKHRANRLAEHLVKAGVRAERIHGNRSQSQRTAALEGFKNGTYPVLVATDIAARGIDVNELGHVVNFDVPLVPDDYIHRVGRTGRAEATGDAFTFVSPEEETNLRDIERAIGRRLAASHRARISITTRSRSSGWKCRSRSESRRSGRGSAKSERGPPSTPPAVPRINADRPRRPPSLLRLAPIAARTQAVRATPARRDGGVGVRIDRPQLSTAEISLRLVVCYA